MKKTVPPDVARAMRDAVAALVEHAGAEAVLISFTRHKRDQTETYAVPFGNVHTVRGLAEYTYGHVVDVDPEDLDEDLNEEAEEEEEEGEEE
jgi:Asp-tRNA(Asn)/Glu-tRNA(Gln) amidotransferase A subunit family amidase|tara:strand:- start:2352 stop:2627 length:276 start_codon:yes stop_codon:yes gene_type:complete